MAEIKKIRVGETDYNIHAVYADSVGSHNHSADNIASGTLAIARGGTGATTAAGALTNLGLTATATELNYMDGVTSNVQTQLNAKASTADLSAHSTDSENPHGVTLAQLGVNVSEAELNYMDGVTANVQTQLDGKAATSHGNHVPVIQTADDSTFLRNDNTWAVVTPANIGAATSGHTHALTDSAITGTLPLTKGGTGATSATGVIANLGAMDLTSAQTASGVKTFTNGINIGNAKITYNSNTNILTFSL